MDPKEIKQHLSHLRDMDAPKEVVKEYEDMLKSKLKKVLAKKKLKFDPQNQKWVEDEAQGIHLPSCQGAEEAPPKEGGLAPAPGPGTTIVIKIGG